MSITYIPGDLLSSDCDVLAHGCNCFHSFGAGIARQFKEKYPTSFDADLRSSRGDPEKLGTFTKAEFDGKMIFNLYTQFRYGYPPRQVDYNAVRDSLEAMKGYLEMFSDFDNIKIGMPKIGCGLAGGDWNIVEDIIEDVFCDKEVFVYVFEMGEVERARDAGSRIEKAIREMKGE